ncbi:MAG: tryptophan--tRNA ligase [Candidatus Thorarchaeota archaeon]|nr:MAG: tryptophan--tRNA ligase [Candidatus Thorarchaeota archaeon]
MTDEEEMVVTPWEVRGKVDYDRLIKEFGTQKISEELKQRIFKIAGEEHFLLSRDLVYSHRDLDWILDKYERGEKFVLYTGRGPSGPVHLGHLIPWRFTKWLQERFDTRLYFQMTNDEKFLFTPDLSIEEVHKYTYENTVDLLALGFEPENTYVIDDIKHIDLMYEIGIRVAKKVTFSTARAVYGFDNSMNIGGIWYTALQAVPAFLHSEIYGVKTPCLIPCAIDQDPYWRVARDVAEKLGYYKPASIQNKFVPGLAEGGKMSASDPNSAIFTIDTPKEARRKVMNAFTGGRTSAKEQRDLGGNPDICSVFLYYKFVFMPDDKDLAKIERKCRGGEILCGECKQILAGMVEEFLEKHQAAREEAKDRVDEFSAARLRDDLRR